MRWTGSACSAAHSKHNVTPEPVNADEQVVQQTAQDAATLLKNDERAAAVGRRPQAAWR